MVSRFHSYAKGMVDFPKAMAAKVRKSQAQQKEETRQALILAAFDMFIRDGYHRASLDAIAEHAGYSKGAIYSNFANKADLFLATMDISSFNFRDRFAESAPTTNAATVQGKQVTGKDDEIRAYAKTLVEGYALATVEFMAVAFRDEGLRERLAAQLDTNIQDVIDDIRDQQDADDPLTPRQVALMISAYELGMNLLGLAKVPGADLGAKEVGTARLLNPKAGADTPMSNEGEPIELTQIEQVEAFIRAQIVD